MARGRYPAKCVQGGAVKYLPVYVSNKGREVTLQLGTGFGHRSPATAVTRPRGGMIRFKTAAAAAAVAMVGAAGAAAVAVAGAAEVTCSDGEFRVQGI